MFLSDIFDNLAAGEFSQIKIGGTPLNQIQPEHVKQILTHVNLGLQDLYRKFSIVRGELTLKLQKGVYVYKLDTSKSLAKAYADAQKWVDEHPGQPAPIVDPRLYYIDDLDNPFRGDINKIEQLNLESNFILPINDNNVISAKNNTQLELIIPKMIVDQVDIPSARFATEFITVSYRAKPVLITRGMQQYYEPCSIEIPLPDLYMQALLYFIASRVLTPIGSVDEYKPGDNYSAKYQQECQNLMSLGFDLTDSNTVTSLRTRGFV